MIYAKEQLEIKLETMLSSSENEVVEFKEAKSDYSYNHLGRYFSALSNEAGYRGLSEAWLIFGITDMSEICGTNYRKGGRSLNNLKKEVIRSTNQKLTFVEIYEILFHGKRVIMFQIPPAIRGIPTTWEGAAYARRGDELCPLPLDKLDAIRNQSGSDWSAKIIENASIEDLDIDAIRKAKELFYSKHSNERSKELIGTMSDSEFLDKIGFTNKGKITSSALMLLGKKESFVLFDGMMPCITWSLYDSTGMVMSYEHFEMPILLSIDKVCERIRNVNYQYFPDADSIIPREILQYDPDVIREMICNSIAHQDYTIRGKINVEEFEYSLVFLNEGSFIPENIEEAISPGYKPPFYRNPLLCAIMTNLDFMDRNSIGIPRMFQIQRNRSFPLPTYDFSKPNRVKVTLYGKILNKNYTSMLTANPFLPLSTVYILDKVQKGMALTDEEYNLVKSQNLVSGIYPNIYVAGTSLPADIDNRNRLAYEDIRSKMSKPELRVFNLINSNRFITTKEIAQSLGLAPRTIERHINSLKKKGIISREGSAKIGKWLIK